MVLHLVIHTEVVTEVVTEVIVGLLGFRFLGKLEKLSDAVPPIPASGSCAGRGLQSQFDDLTST